MASPEASCGATPDVRKEKKQKKKQSKQSRPFQEDRGEVKGDRKNARKSLDGKERAQERRRASIEKVEKEVQKQALGEIVSQDGAVLRQNPSCTLDMSDTTSIFSRADDFVDLAPSTGASARQPKADGSKGRTPHKRASVDDEVKGVNSKTQYDSPPVNGTQLTPAETPVTGQFIPPHTGGSPSPKAAFDQQQYVFNSPDGRLPEIGSAAGTGGVGTSFWNLSDVEEKM